MRKNLESGTKYKAGDIVLCIKSLPENPVFKEGMKARVEEAIANTPNKYSKLCFRILDEHGKPTPDTYCYWADDDSHYMPAPLEETDLEELIREEARKLRGLV